jgi:hypothetical protein
MADFCKMKAFNRIQQELDYYQKFVPKNFTAERKIFWANLRKGKPYNPLFKYNDQLTGDDYIDIKKALSAELGKDPLVDEFINVHLILTDLFLAWQLDDYDKITQLSGGLFGSAEQLDYTGAFSAFKDVRATEPMSGTIFTDKQIGIRFEKELAARSFSGWTIEYRSAVGGNVSIYEVDKKIVIRTGATETLLGLESVICHELDGHAPQAFNAMVNPDHKHWLLSYLGTEQQYEGYATFVEINNLAIPHINSEAEKGILLMLATAVAQQSSFFDAYATVLELCEDPDFAFMAAAKAKRGFRYTSRPGCFQKENSYLMGAMEIIGLLEKDEDNYYRLCQGCFPLSALPLISARRPRWNGVTEFNRDNWSYFKDLMGRVLV